MPFSSPLKPISEPQREREREMGRGKIEIKKIENPTNRQVTYSKRRNGIFKKAQELTVLCDAKVSLIMFSTSGKLHEYTSPNTTTKKMYDQYQKTLGMDLWNTHYEKMQEHLRKLKEVNNKLKREIRQRMGEDLDHLRLEELSILEQHMTASLHEVRERKYHVIKTSTDTYKKKVRNLEQQQRNLLMGFDAKCEDPKFELLENEEDYESAVVYANGVVPNVYAFRMHQGHDPNLPHGGDLGLHDLRLA